MQRTITTSKTDRPGTYPVVKLAASRFGYSSILPSVALDLQQQSKLIKGLIVKTTAGIIEVGRNLLAAKEHLEHGLFVAWVEAEVGISGRTAQRYMAIARLAESKSDSVSLLPPTVVHRLAARSAPIEVVDYVIARAIDGEIVSDGNVAEMIRNARHQRREARKKERRSAAASKAAYRQSAAGREEQERQRRRYEQKHQERKDKASTAAADLIQKLGHSNALMVLEAMSEDTMFEVLAEMTVQLSPAMAPRPTAEDDGLDIPDCLRRVS